MAQRKLPQDVRDLARWCDALAHALIGDNPLPHHALMVDAVRASTQKGSRKALLSIARDLTEWANGLDPERRSTIDEMLKDRLGRGLDEGIDDKMIK